MISWRFFALLFALPWVVPCLADGKPIALVGDQAEAMLIRARVTDLIPVRTELVPNYGGDLRSSSFGQYAAIVYCNDISRAGYANVWNTQAAFADAVDFVERGGVMILTGAAVDAFPDSRCVAEAFPYFSVSGLAGEAGRFTEVKRGLGSIWFCRESLYAFEKSCQEQGVALGEADAEGNWILSEAGERHAALAADYRRVFETIGDVDRDVDNGGWGVTPLGPLGALGRVTELEHAASLSHGLREWTTDGGLCVIGPGVTPTILYAKRRNDNGHLVAGPDLPQELAWHLRRMCGREAVLREYPATPKPADRPREDETVVFVDEDDRFAAEYFGIDPSAHPLGTSFLKRKGNWFLIGGNHSGASHALTYLLEALGCRYLYPSEDGSGKIVPTGRDEVVFPDFDHSFAYRLKHRGVRTALPTLEAMVAEDLSRYGVQDTANYLQRLAASRQDGVSNRDFWAWHGVGDRDALGGDYLWGEQYKDYWERFGTNGTEGEHLEYFALQPNGSRVVDYMTTRPQLCLSFEGLVRQMANDVIARFRNLPGYEGLPVTLPDAGGGAQCMCEACRRLDPPNGRIYNISFGTAKFPYPSPTDRVIWYANRILHEVQKEFPAKKICLYAYNAYTPSPVLYAPDPNLVVLTTCGDYAKNSGVRENFASWARFGISVYWRPNLLRSFRTAGPENFARKLFDDIETLKANGMEGTDFDCYYDQWSAQGFVYYMLAKALSNPDEADFDTLADDYYRSAFGAAAPAMKKYYDLLERHYDRCAQVPYAEGAGFYHYDRTLDCAELRRWIGAALNLATDDEPVRRRIRFFAKALDLAEKEKAMVRAWDARDQAGVDAAQSDLRTAVAKLAVQDVPSVNACGYASEAAWNAVLKVQHAVEPAVTEAPVPASVAATKVDKRWFCENADTTGRSAKGEWDDPVAYSDGLAVLTNGNRFQMTEASTGDWVRIAARVRFDDVATDEDDYRSQAALKVVDRQGANVFQVLTRENGQRTWLSVYGVKPSVSNEQTAVFLLDRAHGVYSVELQGESETGLLASEAGETRFPLAVERPSVSAVRLEGQGAVRELSGQQAQSAHETLEDAARAVVAAQGDAATVMLLDDAVFTPWKKMKVLVEPNGHGLYPTDGRAEVVPVDDVRVLLQWKSPGFMLILR